MFAARVKGQLQDSKMIKATLRDKDGTVSIKVSGGVVQKQGRSALELS